MIPLEKKQVLVADDEANLRRVISALLTREGYDVHVAEHGEAALRILHEHHIDLVITDLRMPGMDGLTLLREALKVDPGLPVVLLTAHGTVDNAVEALKLGAFDYLTKPFDQSEVRTVVRKALTSRELAAADATYEIEPPSARNESSGHRYGIIGDSGRIREVYNVLDKVADTPTTILIMGESGTGKELVARAIHHHSSRRDKPFIKLNCAAIPKDLMESELFGYERGAFTGAVATKPGRFELASGGTLFLDEIGEIPVEMQVKLLRVLQESEFERVGGIKTVQVDVRLVTATNRDLKKDITNGLFREDLYYRLHVIPITLPPLRERATDIPMLADFFLEKFNQRLKKHVLSIDAEAVGKLCAHPWPGNIRELENAMERAVLFSDGATIMEHDLPPEVRSRNGTVPAPRPGLASAANAVSLPSETLAEPSGDGLKEMVKAATSRIERELIVRALEQTQGNVTHGARLLKISRKGLQLKMKELGLRERDDDAKSLPDRVTLQPVGSRSFQQC